MTRLTNERIAEIEALWSNDRQEAMNHIPDLLAEVKTLKAVKAQAEAERDRLIKALTPSIETKRAYMSEVRNDTQQGDFVSWCAIKDIMKLIRSRAKQQTEKQGEQE